MNRSLAYNLFYFRRNLNGMHQVYGQMFYGVTKSQRTWAKTHFDIFQANAIGFASI